MAKNKTDHYRQAEDLLAYAEAAYPSDPNEASFFLAFANAHTALAQVAQQIDLVGVQTKIISKLPDAPDGTEATEGPF